MYQDTPSFYRDEETFERFLGYTSYYRVLQDSVCKVLGFLAPKAVLELGSGTGSTAIRLGRRLPGSTVVAVDNSSEMVELGGRNAQAAGLDNVTFVLGDMRTGMDAYVESASLILLLHSFHHIEDPIQNKVDFLASCFASLPTGGILCIAETFVPVSVFDDDYVEETRALWRRRTEEARASSFWNSLDGVDRENMQRSHEMAMFSAGCEAEAGRFVERRSFEYCVSLTDVGQAATGVGFDLFLSEPVNSVGDGIVLLRKP